MGSSEIIIMVALFQYGHLLELLLQDSSSDYPQNIFGVRIEIITNYHLIHHHIWSVHLLHSVCLSE